jgi:pyruvate/2-oxoglutarate/acetoin dehydrogenase E1 component
MKVYAPMTPEEYRSVWEDFMSHGDPVFVSEHRDSYGLQDGDLPTFFPYNPDIALFAVSAARIEAVKAADVLRKEKVQCSLFHIWRIKPFRLDVQALTEAKVGLVVDTGYETCGLARDIAYHLTQATGHPVHAMGCKDATKMLNPGQQNRYPSAEDICDEVREILGRRIKDENLQRQAF